MSTKYEPTQSNSLHVENDRLIVDREKLHSSPEYLNQVKASEELRRRRERESAKAQAFVPPSNCRQRLKREGRPYPRSSCQACGKWCPRNQDCETLLDAEAINPMLASARVPDAKVVPYGSESGEKDYAYGYEKGYADGWNLCREAMLTAPKPEKE